MATTSGMRFRRHEIDDTPMYSHDAAWDAFDAGNFVAELERQLRVDLDVGWLKG